MVKGPGLYSDIGKKARDLLYRDYQSDHKLTITTYSSTGVMITSSSTKKGELCFADVGAKLVSNNVTTDVKVDTNSNILTTVTVNEPIPGLKTIFSLVLPDQRSGKVEVQYLHEFTGVSTSVGLTSNPIINFSGVLGNDTLALGTDLSFDSASGNVTKCNAGVSFIHLDLIASLTLNNKGDVLNASYYHTISPVTAVGAELSHSFSSNDNTLTVGTQHSLDPLTLVKARVNNNGKASALIQHEWRPKSLFTVSGEFDTKAIEKSAKIGLALALKP